MITIISVPSLGIYIKPSPSPSQMQKGKGNLASRMSLKSVGQPTPPTPPTPITFRGSGWEYMVQIEARSTSYHSAGKVSQVQVDSERKNTLSKEVPRTKTKNSLACPSPSTTSLACHSNPKQGLSPDCLAFTVGDFFIDKN